MSDLAELSLEVRTLSSNFDNFRSLVQSLSTEISRVRSDYIKLGHDFSNFRTEVANVVLEMNKLKALVVTIREEFSRNLETEKKQLLCIIADRSLSISQVNHEHTLTKASLNDMIERLEEVSLDASNALLKANNSDMITTLNRKKLENIQLMVKNYELNK